MTAKDISIVATDIVCLIAIIVTLFMLFGPLVAGVFSLTVMLLNTING